jgi:hypothetical protein
VTFSTLYGIIEGKLQWLSGLSKFPGKSGLNTENTDGLATLQNACENLKFNKYRGGYGCFSIEMGNL